MKHVQMVYEQMETIFKQFLLLDLHYNLNLFFHHCGVFVIIFVNFLNNLRIRPFFKRLIMIQISINTFLTTVYTKSVIFHYEYV